MGVSYYQHKADEAKKMEAIIAERDRLKERLATMTADRDLLDAAAAKATQTNDRLREALDRIEFLGSKARTNGYRHAPSYLGEMEDAARAALKGGKAGARPPQTEGR
jgi:hypothetical protein